LFPRRRRLSSSTALSTQNMEQPTVVFVLGPPGVGKGTQCSRIASSYSFVHLSVGDLLRAEVASGTARGEELQRAMMSGSILPETPVRILSDAVRALGGQRVLVDGFPRSMGQQQNWERIGGEGLRPSAVLVYEADEGVLESRLQKRGRADDAADVMRKRFTAHAEETTPVISYFAERNLVTSIDGGRPEEEVWADSAKAVEALTDVAAAALQAPTPPCRPKRKRAVGTPLHRTRPKRLPTASPSCRDDNVEDS